MVIISVNTAPVGSLFGAQAAGERQVASGIHKAARTGPVVVGRLGLDGDAQADRRLHGGPNKAVYAYPVEHYAFWEAQRRRAGKGDAALDYGALGENLTIEGLLEQDVWLGDRLVPAKDESCQGCPAEPSPNGMDADQNAPQGVF